MLTLDTKKFFGLSNARLALFLARFQGMGHVKISKKFSNVLNMNTCDSVGIFFFETGKFVIDLRFFESLLKTVPSPILN